LKKGFCATLAWKIFESALLSVISNWTPQLVRPARNVVSIPQFSMRSEPRNLRPLL
jgi:hypothetical protein